MLEKFGKLLRAIANAPDPASLPKPQELIATFEIGRGPEDWLFNADIFLYSGSAEEAADGATRSIVALYNPPGSGVIALVEGLSHKTTATSSAIRQCNAADVAAMDNDGNEWGRDPRAQFSSGGLGHGRSASLRILTDQAAAAGTLVRSIIPKGWDTTDRYFWETCAWILLPGSGINVTPAAVNNANMTTFDWRERVVDEMELQGLASHFFK